MENKPTVYQEDLEEEVLKALDHPQKKLPSKLFYDEYGSQLFEQITQLDEYYLTRTEKKVIHNNIDAIASAIGKNAVLIELGSGSSRKTRLLLDRLTTLVSYMPVDIADRYLQKTAEQLKTDYPDLTVIPVVTDYTRHLELPVTQRDYRRQTIFYPGSTIGNFKPEIARDFIKDVAAATDNGAGMLLGVDLKKDKEVLEAAYNDCQGITARFNKNILTHINRVLDTDFKVDQFRHKAFYNDRKGRIEMHLISTTDQSVDIGRKRIDIRKGESIQTENSYKYTVSEVEQLVAGIFEVQQVWTDAERLFSVYYLSKEGSKE